MTWAQITVVQHAVAECLPAVLCAGGLDFRKIEVAEPGELPLLSDSELVVLEAGADRWGLAAACHLRIRKPAFMGPLLIASFEREIDLARAPDGDILRTPGVAFMRLPVLPLAHIAATLSTLARPDDAALSCASATLRRRRIGARAKVLTHARGGQIGPARLQLRLLLDAVASAPSTAGAVAVDGCCGVVDGLLNWAVRCDALLCESVEISYGAGVYELAPVAEEISRLLRLLSLNDPSSGDPEALCRRVLELFDLIEEESKAVDALHMRAE